MISTCRPFHHIKPPSLGDILPAVTLSMWGSVKSTCRPLRTRFGVIFSVAALSMGGGVNIHMPPPSNAFWNNPFHGGVVDGGRYDIHTPPPLNAFWNNPFHGSVVDGGRCEHPHAAPSNSFWNTAVSDCNEIPSFFFSRASDVISILGNRGILRFLPSTNSLQL